MRAKAGDPARTMAQKIFSARVGAGGGATREDLVEVKVDQVVLARAPSHTLAAYSEALALGLKKVACELAVAYETECIATGRATGATTGRARAVLDLAVHGVVIGRAGIGYPGPVHVERFASPARLCLTDEPRIAQVGGIGMLALVAPPAVLATALVRGRAWLRSPRSIQVLMAGKLRSFVSARDVGLELIRRGVGDVVQRVEAAHGAPVVLEFSGPGMRLLSVPERAVVASVAPQLGAAGALFASDERTEVFLRDQRRSKAHRALVPDAGAPCDEVVHVDLAAVDPLVQDDQGRVRAVRDLAKTKVTQVILGGDSGCTLRDMFSVAALLKSKRVPPSLDFLLAVPSRQALEVLAATGTLGDLIATGARLVEPDGRLARGELYMAPAEGVSLQTFDPEPHLPDRPQPIVASPEAVAYAVAAGEIGDPRSFRRPARVTLPRALPTDDVLVLRDRKGAPSAARVAHIVAAPPIPWQRAQKLELITAAALGQRGTNGDARGLAVLCATLDEVRHVTARAGDGRSSVRAVLAPFIPSDLVTLLSGLGVAALQADAAALLPRAGKGGHMVELPAPAGLAAGKTMSVNAAETQVAITWLALPREQGWVTGAAASANPRRT